MTFYYLSNLANHFPLTSTSIISYITFSNSATRSSEHSKLLHIKCFSNSSRHFYFYRLPRLWNAFPHINVNLPLSTIKKSLYKFLWHHFVNTFDPCHVCTNHFCCPCSKCIAIPKPLYIVYCNYIVHSYFILFICR